MVIDPCRVLGRQSRAGRSQFPPPGSVLEEQARPNQPHPFRSSHFHSGFLGYGPQRQKPRRIDPRMQGLEGDLHITFLFMDRSQLQKRG